MPSSLGLFYVAAGQIINPSSGNAILCSPSPQVPRLHLRPLTHLMHFFGTTEIQEHCKVCRVRRRCPRTPSRIIDANLDCAFVENTRVLNIPSMGGPGLLGNPQRPLTTPLRMIMT